MKMRLRENGTLVRGDVVVIAIVIGVVTLTANMNMTKILCDVVLMAIVIVTMTRNMNATNNSDYDCGVIVRVNMDCGGMLEITNTIEM